MNAWSVEAAASKGKNRHKRYQCYVFHCSAPLTQARGAQRLEYGVRNYFSAWTLGPGRSSVEARDGDERLDPFSTPKEKLTFSIKIIGLFGWSGVNPKPLAPAQINDFRPVAFRR
jgi:hypothetical protein